MTKLFIRAVVPDYAKDDFINNQYTAWYVGHRDDEALSDSTITAVVDEFVRTHDVQDIDDGSDVMAFMTFLEQKGYTVLNSSQHAGFAVINVNREMVAE